MISFVILVLFVLFVEFCYAHVMVYNKANYA